MRLMLVGVFVKVRGPEVPGEPLRAPVLPETCASSDPLVPQVKRLVHA